MVAHVSNYHVAVPIHRHATRIVKVRLRPKHVATVLCAASRKSAHVAVRADFADAIVPDVSNYYVAVPVHRHASRTTKARLRPFAGLEAAV